MLPANSSVMNQPPGRQCLRRVRDRNTARRTTKSCGESHLLLRRNAAESCAARSQRNTKEHPWASTSSGVLLIVVHGRLSPTDSDARVCHAASASQLVNCSLMTEQLIRRGPTIESSRKRSPYRSKPRFLVAFGRFCVVAGSGNILYRRLCWTAASGRRCCCARRRRRVNRLTRRCTSHCRELASGANSCVVTI